MMRDLILEVQSRPQPVRSVGDQKPARTRRNGGHGGLEVGADAVAAGDSFLLNTVNAIMNSSAWTGNSVIFITWDEADFTGSGFQGFGDDRGCCDSVAGRGGGLVVTITISHSDHAPRTSNVAYNHHSMLATIEDGWKLGCLAFTCDTANVPPMTYVVEGSGSKLLRSFGFLHVDVGSGAADYL